MSRSERVLFDGRNFHLLMNVVAVAALVQVAGCSKLQQGDAQSNESGAAESREDFISVDEDTTPEERRYLEAGKPFIVALAAGNFQEAYAMLSSHARKSSSQEQFLTPTDDASQSKTTPLDNLSAEQFAEQMQQVANRYGPPHSPQNLYVETTDPEVLAGRGAAFDRMLAIGNMPASIPAGIRKASLRGSVSTRLSADDIKKLAEEYNSTPEEIAKDDEMQPYYNIKFVLIEDEGGLKVGYFEIMPPSILD